MTPSEVAAALEKALFACEQTEGADSPYEIYADFRERLAKAANPKALRILLDAYASALMDAAKLRDAVSRLLVLARTANLEGDDAAVFARAALDDSTKGAAE